jgi:hypothetical protein
VDFPGKPSKDQAPGILGIKTRTVFTCSAEGMTFTIMGQPVPPAALKKGGATSVLAASRDSLATAYSGKVTNDKSVKIGEFAAREFRVTADSLRQNVIRGMTVIAGRRLYLVFIMGPESAAYGAAGERFFDSFMPTQ